MQKDDGMGWWWWWRWLSALRAKYHEKAGLFSKRSLGGFFFFIFKKIKISKIYVSFGKFQKYTPVALWGGDRAQM